MDNVAVHAQDPVRPLTLAEQLLSIFLRALPIKHGRHRILDYIAPRAFTQDGMLVEIALNGKHVIVDPSDLVGWHFAILKSFDPEVVEVLNAACEGSSGEVFWDIGANKGSCFCGLAAKRNNVRVVAIEPQASLAPTNLHNLQTLCSTGYEYVQAGIGESESELELTIPENNKGRASLNLRNKRPTDVTEKIKIKTAKNIASQSKYGWPSLIKLDVEGYEPQVIRALAPCFSQGHCKVLVFENHKRETTAFDEIRKLIVPHGYNLYGIKKTPWATYLLPCQNQIENTTDYAAIRKDTADSNRALGRLIHH
ncbi:FkbM family methyltransferase [Teredinibacter turnerae]|uniref:FkbM family methyltransferase n=1 Tax=Teredinibacter turnerae TaxID=2426 RepID=UPI0003770122|nr:FkbM family methyltransferase [Teredinibacter turnerae]